MKKEEYERLETMLDVEIDHIEEEGDTITIYIPEDVVGKAVGTDGNVIHTAEKVLDKTISVEKTKTLREED